MPVRELRASHAACGTETRVRVPRPVPAHAVRRVVCQGCARPFEAEAVEVAAPAPPSRLRRGLTWLRSRPARLRSAPAALRSAPTRLRATAARLRPRRPQWLDAPPGKLWRWASIPLAAAGVVAGLLLIQGSDDPAPDGGSAATSRAVESGDAQLVRQPGWSLAMPDGWKRIEGGAGAAFAAAAVDGSADATLWVERDPSLSFAEFEARSLEQLRQLTGTAGVIERTTGPTPEKTIVRLQADAPAEAGAFAPYTVTLRASGPYRYYLSTSIQPGAPREADDAIELIHNSFLPQPGEQPVSTGSTPGGSGGTP